MGTAILRSQDCLRGRFPQEALTLALPRSVGSRRSPNVSTRNPNYGATANLQQSRRRKRSPTGLGSNLQDRGRDRYAADRAAVAKAPAKNLVMGEVKILRRGEALVPEKNNIRGIGVVAGDDRRKPMAAKSGEDPDLALGSTDRLGPDPETVQKQIKAAEFKVMDAIYAGSSAFYASPPPSSVPLPGFLGWNGAATTDLRRLLRLDLV